MGSINGRMVTLEQTLDSLTKRFGEGTIMRLGEATHLEVESIPTGSLGLDIALGVGGLPRGRVIEVYGPESSGKTTLCQHVIAEAQKRGGICAFVDMEHALDPGYAARCDVDVENLYVSQPDAGEQALEIAEALIRSGTMDVVVIDSVAALVPRAEIEGEMGDAHVGLQARLMSQALRKLSGVIKQTNTIVIFTNQLRMKIGVMFGSPETTSGGNALKFYASVRLDMRRIQSIKAGGDVIGNRTRVRVKKNKVAPPFTEAEFDIMYNSGISKEGDVLDLATDYDIVEKRGAYFRYGDLLLGQGRENAKTYLMENPSLLGELENLVRIGANLQPLELIPVEDSPDRLKILIPVRLNWILLILYSTLLLVWLLMLAAVVFYLVKGLSSSFVLTALLLLWIIVWLWFGRFLSTRWQYAAANREILFIDDEQLLIRRPVSLFGITTAYDIKHISPFYYSDNHRCPAFDYAFLHVYFAQSLAPDQALNLIEMLNTRYFPEEGEA